ncbi:MAG: transposase [Acidobacteriia bacterium]|nr:transposase [Terriglobia bacterium]
MHPSLTGDVIRATVPRHSIEKFVAFLADVVAHQPRGKEIHIIVNNLWTHRTHRVQQFLGDYQNVQLQLTLTSSSWLNQVETWSL